MRCYKVEYTEHSEGKPQFVSSIMRLCVESKSHSEEESVRSLSRFKQNDKGLFSTICGDCLKEIRDEELFQRQAKSNLELAERAQIYATALSKASEISKSGGQFADTFDAVCRAAGGRETLAGLIGQTMKSALTLSAKDKALPADLARGLKVAELFIKAAAAEQKMAKPINWRDITEEEQREILTEPAKTLLLRDKRFREELLNSPEVRKALLAEVGVALLDPPEDDDDEDEAEDDDGEA